MKLLEQDELEEQEAKDDSKRPELNDSEKKNPLVAILLAVIVVLLICIFFLLLLLPSGKNDSVNETLQQSIADYASEQKQNDKIDKDEGDVSPAQGAVVVEFADINGQAEDEEETEAVGSDALNSSVIVVDIEDENDDSYTKEFILNEMMPYFADNNLEAVWDLAHLKRYIKLSAGLKGTNTYYYLGDVDSQGQPDGLGLAIYEENTYYYGSWSHGMRSGGGRWYRFYIDTNDKSVRKEYQAHSYAGQWSNDLPNGEGAEHYDVDISKIETREKILQNVIGNFTDGLYDGEMYANTVDYRGIVDEWYGTAKKGVFELWKDMSSIGECSVWQNRDDEDLYLDIDKKENKKQGLRELLDITQK